MQCKRTMSGKTFCAILLSLWIISSTPTRFNPDWSEFFLEGGCEGVGVGGCGCGCGCGCGWVGG
jgi:hypothetical protein